MRKDLIRSFTRLIVPVIFSLSVIHVSAQGFLKASGTRIVNERGENVLLRGMGLGGWMLQEGYMLGIQKEGQQYRIRQRIEALIGKQKTAEFYEAWLANHTTKADVDSLKAWGFNSIRLPMHYNLYTLPVDEEPVAGANTWLQKGFDMTDSLLAWCKANEMYLILDLHAAPGGQGNDLNISDRDPAKPSLWQSEANQQKMIALWRKLAERYVNEPWIGGYDIINEPNWGFENLADDPNGLKEKKNEPLKKLLVEVTQAIRSVDNNHIIIIEGNGWGNNYNNMLPPWDKNMVLSFHKYWNYNTTESISHILKVREQYNIPVWLGESGENSNVWFADAIRLLEQNNIGWAWWPLKKLGHNNPLQWPPNAGYAKVLEYFKNGGEKPTEAEAYDALMKLAKQTNIRHNIVHYDVIDAMIRQPFSTATLPFKHHQLKRELIVKAVDYDFGRNRYAYYDLDTANYRVSTGKNTPGNRGNMYKNDGVDINRTDKGDYYVDAIEDGEWLQYTIDVAKPGKYNITLKILPASTEGRVSIYINDAEKKKLTILPATHGEWIDFPLGATRLQKGKQVIRIQAHKGGFALAETRFQ